MRFSPKEVHRELLRELGMRRSVYSRRVVERKMSGQDADRKIALMEQAAAMIAENYDVEDRQGDLLGGK